MEQNHFQHFEVRETATRGKGTFTRIPFAKGECVIEYFGARVPAEEVFRGAYDPERCIQLNSSTCVVPNSGPEECVNHCCEPNTGLVIEHGRLFLVALRDLLAGEEITFDYSTSTDLSDGWEMTCRCESPHCRKTIRDFSLLPRELQERYLELGIVPAFIREGLSRATHVGSCASSPTGLPVER